MKSAFWKKDWFLGLGLTLLFLVFSGSALLVSLEWYAYDVGVKASSRMPSDKVAVIAIDDQSIDNIGRWPWSRDIHAEMINKLKTGGAKVIGYTPIFSEPQQDPGLDYIHDILEIFNARGLTMPIDTHNAASAEDDDPVPQAQALLQRIDGLAAGDNRNNPPLQTELRNLSQAIAEVEQILYIAEDELNVDRKLAMSIQDASNVVMSMWFFPGEPLGNPDSPLPIQIQNNAISQIVTGGQQLDFFPVQSNNAILPLDTLSQHAAGVGNLFLYQNIDGGMRTETLAVDYYGSFYPSYSLQLAAKSLNLSPQDIVIHWGKGIQLGKLEILTNPSLQMYSFFYADKDNKPAFSVDSFYDIYSNKVPTSKFKDKIVIVGPTASGISKVHLTPVNPIMPEALTLAHIISSILNEDFFVKPEWSIWAWLGAIIWVGLYLMLLLPRLGATAGAISSGILLIGLLLTHYLLMTMQAVWVELMLPAMLLLSGHILLSTKRFLVTERGKLHSDMESAESNRMLGLAFQGQGQLDIAFEKFRKCPKDDSIAEVMYNLALDYERKRQFSKAGNVYQYIHSFSPKFRDVEQRIARSKKMEETIVLGGSGASTAGGTLILDAGGGDVEKPMLGRYQVEKELGKGAMGVVYLGKDPKISRIVAIKTMALSQEFDADELDEVKQRFFREAETAGRLNHPNIVTIYDAGEEHDLAYIAMEFLKGKDLALYTKKDTLLPLPKVLDIIGKAANALDYAHSQNVVHRDIKPANIMYEAESGQVKITDFGIARITDSSKTKTGMVLGTPSYMSPEQLAGKKVDGRSDLYSLGVMLFQMLSGELPFKADSMATLMYKITHEPHPSVTELNPKLPAQLEIIVAKTLEKNADDRYQSGAALAADLLRLSGTH